MNQTHHSPAVARFMRQTAHKFTPRPAAEMTQAELKRGAETSVGKMLFSMLIVLLLALAYAKLESKAATGSAQLDIAPIHSRYRWHKSGSFE